MKFAELKNKIELSSDIQGLSFGIKDMDMGLVLDILRSKIYKDRISAICREVMSNSRDANREAGNPDTPIRVRISDEDDLSDIELGISIVFEDDGPGISPERMADVFVNYGSSTKRDTNTQTGGFGLGAKTPFSYSDNFSIITKVNGIKYTYIAAIEETKTGKMYPFKKEETTESNGTIIIVPIKPEDRQSFERSVREITGLWSIKPECFNFRTDPYTYTIMEHEGVQLTSNYSSYNKRVVLLIDEIPYPADLSLLQISDQSSERWTLILPFKTGQLTLSATRESVQYDDKTVKLIRDHYNKSVQIIKRKLETELDLCSNYVEAFVKLSEMRSGNVFYAFVGEKNFFYKGQKIVQSLKTEEVNIDHRGISKSLNLMDAPIFYLDKQILDQARLNYLDNKYSVYYIIIISKELRKFKRASFSYKKVIAKKLRTAINHLEWLKSIGLSFTNMSDVPRNTEKKEKSALKYVPYLNLNNDRSRTGYKRGSISIGNLKDMKVCYHIYSVKDLKGKEAQQLRKWDCLFKSLRSLKDKMSWLRDIVFINKKYENLFIEAGIPKVSEMMKQVDAKVMTDISNSIVLEDREIDSDMIKLICRVGLLSYNPVNCGIYRRDLPDDFLKLYPSTIDVKRVKELEKIYPLLPLLTYDKENDKHIREYIRLIDKELLCQKSNG